LSFPGVKDAEARILSWGNKEVEEAVEEGAEEKEEEEE
jgi:hypothetical protein